MILREDWDVAALWLNAILDSLILNLGHCLVFGTAHILHIMPIKYWNWR